MNKMNETQQTPAPPKWVCVYCNAVSYDDNISPADGICYMRPSGAGNHTFRRAVRAAAAVAVRDRTTNREYQRCLAVPGAVVLPDGVIELPN